MPLAQTEWILNTIPAKHRTDEQGNAATYLAFPARGWPPIVSATTDATPAASRWMATNWTRLNAAAQGIAVVPDLTFRGDIKLNLRLRLHQHRRAIASSPPDIALSPGPQWRSRCAIIFDAAASFNCRLLARVQFEEPIRSRNFRSH